MEVSDAVTTVLAYLAGIGTGFSVGLWIALSNARRVYNDLRGNR